MLVREFLSIRRAFNFVRRKESQNERLTFEELGVLAHLAVSHKPLCASDLADAQGALRPTMTHRMNHLVDMGFISQTEGTKDHRTIICELSQQGLAKLNSILKATKEFIRSSDALARTTPERLLYYIDAMQACYVDSSGLILLSLLLAQNVGKTISELVDDLGLLQPTVSMAVSALIKAELCFRKEVEGARGSSLKIFLSEAGEKRAFQLSSTLEGLTVHRHLQP